MRRPPPSRRLIAAALAALALAGCGRKGPLELPPTAAATPVATPAQRNGATAEASGATQAAAAQLQETQTRTLGDTDSPGLIQSPNIVYEPSAIAKLNSATKNPARPINAPPVAQPSTFILDPLIK